MSEKELNCWIEIATLATFYTDQFDGRYRRLTMSTLLRFSWALDDEI